MRTLIVVLFLMIFTACSSTQETTQERQARLLKARMDARSKN